MAVDRPSDPPLTRNQARKIKAKRDSSPSASFPATTAAVPACGGVPDGRRSDGDGVVASDCVTNTTAAASFFSPESHSLSASLPPLIVSSPFSASSAAATAAGLPPVVASVPSGAAGGVRVPPRLGSTVAFSTSVSPPHLASPADLPAVAEPIVETPAGTTGMIGDVVVEGRFRCSRSLTAVTNAVTGCCHVFFVLGFSGRDGFGSWVLTTASVSNSEATTRSSPDKFNEVGPDMESTLSEEKAPNVGSFVDSKGKVQLHADETDVAHKPVSFADLLKKSANLVCGKGKLKYYPPVVTELGTRRAIIPNELVKKQASEWTLTLVGYFIGKRPAFPFVQFHAKRMWKKYGLTDVILNDQGYFFFKFNSDQGLNFVFENGPWLFNGMPVFIQRWQPGLCFDKHELKTVPLWVNIYGLLLDVWDYEIISQIASIVGEPVSVDRYTDEMCETKSGRANFARVLVNVSADYELPSDIDAIILGKLSFFENLRDVATVKCSVMILICVSPRTADEVKKVNPDVGESSIPKDDGFKFPKRKKKPKPTVDPLKVGSKVAFNTGIKINQRYVPKVILPTIDPLYKGKAKLNDENPSPKAPKFNTERIPMPIEDPQWSLDKKEVDDFIEKRGVGLEPLDYFIGRWERVFGKEPDGTLRGFTLPDRQIISNDDGSDSDSEDDAELVEDAPSDATLGTPYGTWLRQKQDIDRRLAEKDWPTVTQMATWTEKQVVYFFKQCEQLSEADRQLIPKTEH
ncbi:LOW QUALITY PROTEIN: hypothetical protein OSB04_011831 [Centaurea solstitialis]|uniref:DUF4283 domain-containing protein n=1 Tax=Centaurea solstitialis TaxID=347529 RepID=A0AA38TTA6_9ASTR|nr:LOW QUALITY PROTEIN: hypothetical protein OSB04_011831 [Centaurea solstitialis]